MHMSHSLPLPLPALLERRREKKIHSRLILISHVAFSLIFKASAHADQSGRRCWHQLSYLRAYHSLMIKLQDYQGVHLSIATVKSIVTYKCTTWQHYCIIFTGTLSKTFSVSPNDSHAFDFISQFCSLGNYNLGVAHFFICPGRPQLWHDHLQCHERSGLAWPRDPSPFSDLLMECHCDSKWSLKTTITNAYFIIPGFFFYTWFAPT